MCCLLFVACHTQMLVLVLTIVETANWVYRPNETPCYLLIHGISHYGLLKMAYLLPILLVTK